MSRGSILASRIPFAFPFLLQIGQTPRSLTAAPRAEALPYHSTCDSDAPADGPTGSPEGSRHDGFIFASRIGPILASASGLSSVEVSSARISKPVIRTASSRQNAPLRRHPLNGSLLGKDASEPRIPVKFITRGCAVWFCCPRTPYDRSFDFGRYICARGVASDPTYDVACFAHGRPCRG